MRVYLSGAISGLTQEEFQTNFGRGEALVLSLGHEPVNPVKIVACQDEDCHERYGVRHDLPVPGGGAPVKEDGITFLHHYSCYMKYDLLALLECDAIAMLPNWRTSRGAALELKVAEVSGLRITAISDDYTRLFFQ